MRLVMREKLGDERVGALLVRRRAGGREAALDQRPRSGSDEDARVPRRLRRQALAGEKHVKRSDQIGRRVGQRAVEVENENRRKFAHALA